MDILWRIVATLGLVALNAYFVAVEFAAVGARATRLEEQAKTSLLSALAARIKKRLDLYLSSCQLGVTIASLGLGAVTEPAVVRVLEPVMRLMHIPAQQSHVIAFAIAFAASTSLHIVLGEQAPKNWAILTADRVLPVLCLPLIVFTYLFYPVIWTLNWASNTVLRATGVKLDPARHGPLPHSETELRALLAEAMQEGTIEGPRGRLLVSAFGFGELKVRQIMTSRPQVDFLVLGQPVGEMLRTVQKSAYTRLPLCESDLDHVIGLVHMKDLFNHLQLIPGRLKFTDEKTPTGEAIAIAAGLPGSAVHVIGSGDIDLSQIRRDILFVPELLPVPRLLRQFQSSHVHMAVVVDEYGVTQGIVTLEDVIEELVGDIEDEFDQDGTPTFAADGENYRVSGLMPLHELRERLSLGDLDAPNVDTLGGYIVQQLGRIPRAGEVADLGPYKARVLSVSQKRIGQVLITPATQQAARDDGPGTV